MMSFVQETVEAHKAHDVWAVCVTLFVMLTGSFPWNAAQEGDAEFDAFLNGDFSQDPWNTFTDDLIEVCVVNDG